MDQGFGEFIMAHGKRASILANARGKDYFKKKGFLKKCKCWLYSVSVKPGSNKKTKNLTKRSERQQFKNFLNKNGYDEL